MAAESVCCVGGEMKTDSSEQRIILLNTSLCAIVRDEIMNPAGGIVDFVDSTLPYVEEGVIVDTGSKDGTREALEELKTKYPHLEVYDREFRGFADARNESLKHCKTKRALVLDADERLTREDLQKLVTIISLDPEKGFNFKFRKIYPNGFQKYQQGLNPRLFHTSKFKFEREIWEYNEPLDLEYVLLKSDIEIKHFMPDADLVDVKLRQFYRRATEPLDEMEDGRCGRKVRNWIKKNMKPLRDFPFFQDLRKYNPEREKYR